MPSFTEYLSFCLVEYLSFKAEIPDLLAVCPEAANFVMNDDDEINEDYIEDYVNNPHTPLETLKRIYEVVKSYGDESPIRKYHFA